MQSPYETRVSKIVYFPPKLSERDSPQQLRNGQQQESKDWFSFGDDVNFIGKTVGFCPAANVVSLNDGEGLAGWSDNMVNRKALFFGPFASMV